MNRDDLTEKLLDIKLERGWKRIHEAIGGLSPFLITAACLGQMKLPKAQARKAAELFGLSEAEERLINEAPYRGSIPSMRMQGRSAFECYEIDRADPA